MIHVNEKYDFRSSWRHCSDILTDVRIFNIISDNLLQIRGINFKLFLYSHVNCILYHYFHQLLLLNMFQGCNTRIDMVAGYKVERQASLI